jgi:hypothetical protein
MSTTALSGPERRAANWRREREGGAPFAALRMRAVAAAGVSGCFCDDSDKGGGWKGSNLRTLDEAPLVQHPPPFANLDVGVKGNKRLLRYFKRVVDLARIARCAHAGLHN